MRNFSAAMPTSSPIQRRLPALLAPALAALWIALPCAAQNDTLSVAGREDHSPHLGVNPVGKPALTWIATLPDPIGSLGYDELFYAEHDSSGWSAPLLVAGPGNYFTPSTIFSNDGARWTCAAKYEAGDSQILCIRDLAGSATTFTLGDALAPDFEPSICAARNDSVLVVWQGWRNANYEILFSVGTAAGFSQPVVISASPRSDRDPEIVWGNNRAWIVWSSYRGEPYNLICRTFDGANLSPAVQLTTSYRARNFHPRLAFDEEHDLLWISWILVNQAWNGFNQHEFPGLYDRGSPRIRAFNGTTLYEPMGLNSDHQYPLPLMEALGYQRYLYDEGTRPMVDRYGPGVAIVACPGGRVWCLYKPIGTLTEQNIINRYWGVVGLSYEGNAWSSPTSFLELRSSLGWEPPASVCAGNSMWIAWSADHRQTPIITNGMNMFGNNLDIVVKATPSGSSGSVTPILTSLGAAPSPGVVAPENRPAFQVTIGESTATLYWGDTHRHSVDFSWDADVDPPLQQTAMYALDWLGDDFLVPSDHAERDSPGVWAWARKWAQILDVPGRFRTFTGYERSMQGGAGGHQNVMYRDPEDFLQETAAFPVTNNWHTMYAAQSGIDVLSIPHTTAQCGVMTDWNHLSGSNPDSLPAPLHLVEVYQAARESFEYPGCPWQYDQCVTDSTNGWVNVALALGMKLGLISSSDHGVRASFVGVYASSLSRDTIWSAMRDRRCYGTRRVAKMNVDFRVAASIMGSEVTSPAHPQIHVVIEADHPLSAIEINKDGDPEWFVTSCSGTDTTFTIVDPDAAIEGTSSFYYLRVRDEGLHAIWTSPVWVNFDGTVTESPVHLSPQAELALAASPNPFRDAIDLSVHGLENAGARLRIHDVTGRLIRSFTFAGGTQATAFHWDGKDTAGKKVSAGVYYAVVQARGETRNTKIVRVR
jgi:hypothetical protein